MSETMDDAQKVEFLKGLGLSPDAPSLVEPTVAAKVVKEQTAKVKDKAKKKAKKDKGVDIDTHAIPVSDIVFDTSMVEDFDLTNGSDFRAASQVLFDTYKSKHKDKERNGFLHRRISEFLSKQRLLAKTGGVVSERVEVSKEVNDLAQVLQQKGLTAADLVALLNK